MKEVLIPLQSHFPALHGFGKLLQTIDLANKRINPHLRASGVRTIDRLPSGAVYASTSTAPSHGLFVRPKNCGKR